MINVFLHLTPIVTQYARCPLMCGFMNKVFLIKRKTKQKQNKNKKDNTVVEEKTLKSQLRRTSANNISLADV